MKAPKEKIPRMEAAYRRNQTASNAGTYGIGSLSQAYLGKKVKSKAAKALLYGGAVLTAIPAVHQGIRHTQYRKIAKGEKVGGIGNQMYEADQRFADSMFGKGITPKKRVRQFFLQY